MRPVTVEHRGLVIGFLADELSIEALEALGKVLDEEPERIDYVLGEGEAGPSSPVRRPLGLDHGSCALLRHRRRDVLVAAAAQHIDRTLEPARGLSWRGVLLVGPPGAVLAPTWLPAQAAGLTHRLLSDGWRIHIGPRIPVRDGHAEVGSAPRIPRRELTQPGRWPIRGIVIDRPFGELDGSAAETVMALLAGCPTPPGDDPEEVLAEAVAVARRVPDVVALLPTDARQAVDWITTLRP